MGAGESSLLTLLRCEMTAVNQQFVHILALRNLGDKKTAARIAEIDDLEFPNAMRIAEHLIASDVPIEISGDHFVTGWDRESMLAAERTMEDRMENVLSTMPDMSADVQWLVNAASEPRADYRAWLDIEIGGARLEADPDPAPLRCTLADLFAHLTALMEQTLVHSLLHWRYGDKARADDAWFSSGAAMMHLTRMVGLGVREGTCPTPGRFPRFNVAQRPEKAHELESALATLCAVEAQRLAGSSHAASASLGHQLASYSAQLAERDVGGVHPAADWFTEGLSKLRSNLSPVR